MTPVVRRKKKNDEIIIRRREGIKKGVYLLPNTMTSLSLFFGFWSIVSTFTAHYERAAWFILVSMIFDSFDGTVARVTGTASDFGAEYDSLSDLVAFGVAPGILIYAWALQPFGKWGLLSAFLYVLCTALRLARFNVQSATIEKKAFQGLPSPGAAAGIASTVLFFMYIEGGRGGRLGDIIRERMITPHHVAFLLLTITLALLMVSTIRYRSGKDLSIFKRLPFLYLLLTMIVVLLIVAEPQIMIFLLIYTYILSGIVTSIIFYKKRKKEKEELKEMLIGTKDQ